MFKNKNENKVQEFSPDLNNSKMNSYIQAKFEWNERYGFMLRDKKFWQFSAIFLSIANILSIFSLIYIALQSKYVIKVTEKGQPIQIEKIDPNTNIDSAVLSYQLSQFITDIRTVTTDIKLKKVMMERAKGYSSQNTFNTLQEYWAKSPPDKIAEILSISVLIDSVLPIKNSESWQVNWTEFASQNGVNIGKTKFTAILNIGKNLSKTEFDHLKNPTGLVVKSISWSKFL